MANTSVGWGLNEYYPKFLPSSSNDNGMSFKSNSTWLKLVPRMIDSFNLSARSGAFIPSANQPPNTQVNLHYLLPESFSIATSHAYKEYTTVVGMAKDMTAKFLKAAQQTIDVSKGVGKAIDKFAFDPSQTSLTELNATPLKASGQALRNDDPVVYENSGRKTLNVELDFSTYTHPKEDVFDPINMLLQLSSPDLPTIATGGVGLITFDYPYYFELSICDGTTMGETMFGIKSAVITRISPQYRGPYIDGYPTSGSLNITFEDAEPMYSNTSWKMENSVVTVSSVSTLSPITVAPVTTRTDIEGKNYEYYNADIGPPTSPTTNIAVKNSPYYSAYANQISRVAGIGRVELQNLPYYQSIVPLVGSSLNTVL